jgi:hypothetical protein
LENEKMELLKRKIRCGEERLEPRKEKKNEK